MDCFQSKTAHLHSPDDPSSTPEPATKPGSRLYHYSISAFSSFFGFDNDPILKWFVGNGFSSEKAPSVVYYQSWPEAQQFVEKKNRIPFLVRMTD